MSEPTNTPTTKTIEGFDVATVKDETGVNEGQAYSILAIGAAQGFFTETGKVKKDPNSRGKRKTVFAISDDFDQLWAELGRKLKQLSLTSYPVPVKK
jgi:hypothetical protein